MSEKDTGGAAFPSLRVYTDRDGEVCSQQIDGMTLRDYFAAKAMQGLAAQMSSGRQLEPMAKAAYEIANAMLEARK